VAPGLGHHRPAMWLVAAHRHDGPSAAGQDVFVDGGGAKVTESATVPVAGTVRGPCVGYRTESSCLMG
jgi:hypothetical protein